LKARVDLGDQTAEFIPFEVMRTAILTYFYLSLGIIYARVVYSITAVEQGSQLRLNATPLPS